MMTPSTRVNPDPNNRPAALLVGSGYHLYREHPLWMVPRAAQVWLGLDREPTWERLYGAGHERLEPPPAGHVTSRYAYVVATAGTVVRCAEAAESAARPIRLRAGDAEACAKGGS